MADTDKNDDKHTIVGIKVVVLPFDQKTPDKDQGTTPKLADDNARDIRFALSRLENLSANLKTKIDEAGLKKALEGDYNGVKETKVGFEFEYAPEHGKKVPSELIAFEATPESIKKALAALGKAGDAAAADVAQIPQGLKREKYDNMALQLIN